LDFELVKKSDDDVGDVVQLLIGFYDNNGFVDDAAIHLVV